MQKCNCFFKAMAHFHLWMQIACYSCCLYMCICIVCCEGKGTIKTLENLTFVRLHGRMQGDRNNVTKVNNCTVVTAADGMWRDSYMNIGAVMSSTQKHESYHCCWLHIVENRSTVRKHFEATVTRKSTLERGVGTHCLNRLEVDNTRDTTLCYCKEA